MAFVLENVVILENPKSGAITCAKPRP